MRTGKITAGEFLGEFWKSFRKAVLFTIGGAALGVLIVSFFDPDFSTPDLSRLPKLEQGVSVSFAIQAISVVLALFLFWFYCHAWAGAMWRCGITEDIGGTTVAGAAIPATVISITVLVFSLASAESSLFAAAIGATKVFVLVFLFTGLLIAWQWFRLGFDPHLW